MKMGVLGSALVVAAMSVGAGAANAQAHRMHLGAHFSYNFDAEDSGFGMQFSAPLASFLEFYPSFDYYLVDPGSMWAVNADVKLRLAGENTRWLYLGAGLNLTRVSVNGDGSTDTGLNVLAGAETTGGSIHPFGEMRLSFANGSNVQIAFGLNFTLGSGRGAGVVEPPGRTDR